MFHLYLHFRAFHYGSRSRFCPNPDPDLKKGRSGSGFCPNPDPDLKKGRSGSETLVQAQSLEIFGIPNAKVRLGAMSRRFLKRL